MTRIDIQSIPLKLKFLDCDAIFSLYRWFLFVTLEQLTIDSVNYYRITKLPLFLESLIYNFNSITSIYVPWHSCFLFGILVGKFSSYLIFQGHWDRLFQFLPEYHDRNLYPISYPSLYGPLLFSSIWFPRWTCLRQKPPGETWNIHLFLGPKTHVPHVS